MAAGMKVSAYHYSWFTSDAQAVAEANYFAAAAKKFGLSSGTVMVNDIEEPQILGKGNHTNNSRAFENRLKSLGYGNVRHYIGLNWLTTGRINAATIGYKNIWVAAYPYNLSTTNFYTQYGAWQWSSQLSFPGISGNFDINADYTSTFSNPTPTPPANSVQMYRVYNPNSGEHFYTQNVAEKNNLVSKGWKYEGIGWNGPTSGNPVYRLYNPNAGDHHYTLHAYEKDNLIKKGWRYEGISWYSLGGAQPIAPVERTLNVPYVSQYVPVFSPWGCAGASMTMLLRYKGKTVDLKYVQDNLPMYPNDKGGQKGNVYTGAGFGWVITPDSLANYAKKWYKNVSNISNVSTQNIVDRIINGNPVLYYGYSSYQANTIRNHCKVIAGYKDNKFLVYDPLYYSANAKAGSGGPNKTYDRGAMAWVSITDFAKEWDGRAIGVS